MGGMLCGVRKTFRINKSWISPSGNVISVEINIQSQKTQIVGVYNTEGVNSMKKEIECQWLENPNRTMIIGDWNARVGELGSIDSHKRFTKDITTNAEGKRWVEFIQKMGMDLLNGNMEGDWEGEFTHDGPYNSSVIDYAAASIELMNELKTFNIHQILESDHHPLIVSWSSDPIIENEEELVRRVKQDWSAKGIEQFQRKLRQQPANMTKGTWTSMAERIKRATTVINYTNYNTNERNWFDRDCYEKRKEVKSAMHKYKLNPVLRSNYLIKRKEYKDLLKVKRKKSEENFTKQLEAVNTINEAWSFINQERKNKKYVKPAVEDEVLMNYFKELLDGTNTPDPDEVTQTKVFNESVQLEELQKVIRNLKHKKAAGPDDIRAEAFKAGLNILGLEFLEILNSCINGGPMPENWRDTRYWPIHKKGKRDVAQNYRGIAISNIGAKIWSQILCNRLTEEVEEKGLLPETQSGFRKGRSTIDNIYILNAFAQDRLENGGNMFALFIDLSAAFDTVNRSQLFQLMERKGISDYLIECCKEIYRRTPIEMGQIKFYTNKGVKQGCPLSPLLFSLYISDIEEVLRKAQAGGIVSGRHKIHTLAYADDMALLANSPEELREMMRILRKYLEKLNLRLNVAKTKVMKFSRSGRQSKEKWTWGAEEIEEVNEFKYLGFLFSSTTKHTAHARQLEMEAMKKLPEVWGIGERRFQNNYKIRAQMFDSLIRNGLLYGAEIFGWKEWDSIESVQRKFIKWTLSLPPYTKTNVLMAETGRLPLQLETVFRAMRFELKLQESQNQILKHAWKIQKNNKERREFFDSIGWLEQEESNKFIFDRFGWMEACEEARRKYVDGVRRSLIDSSYWTIIPSKLPTYLERGIEIKLISRFRCGAEERGKQLWRHPADRMCRVCGTEEETVDHLITTCCPTELEIKKLLGDDGKGLDWMRGVIRARE